MTPVLLTPDEAKYVRDLILCTNHGVSGQKETAILKKIDRCLDQKLSRLDELHRQKLSAGDRRDGAECDRIEAEIDALKQEMNS